MEGCPTCDSNLKELTTMHFFVYGTLMKDLKNHDYIAKDILTREEAWIPGTLYHLEYGYPALILDGNGKVKGEWVQVRNGDEIVRKLDALEDYYGPGHPDNHYERRQIEVLGQKGYVYEWVLSLKGISTLVPHGDWRAYLKGQRS
jgi:gamma-glutamylcyclotransferase (GGCT)/AIG2-like uncharacterized protein YtfP